MATALKNLIHHADAEFICQLADVARQKTLKHFRNGAAADNKYDTPDALGVSYDPVTAGDREAEKAMRELIATHRCDDGIMGEEFGEKSSKNGRVWYLDPIDGTRAYVAGLPLWTTLIGLVVDGVPQLGLIDQPFLAERYIGTEEAAYLVCGDQTQQLLTRACKDLTDAILATTDPFIFTAPEKGAFEHLRAAARITRYGCDAYAYARLAAGDIDLVVESGLQPYDMAALVPVIKGAGGNMVNWRGEPVNIASQICAYGDKAILSEALLALKRSADPKRSR